MKNVKAMETSIMENHKGKILGFWDMLKIGIKKNV